jgi:hypothetical protein
MSQQKIGYHNILAYKKDNCKRTFFVSLCSNCRVSCKMYNYIYPITGSTYSPPPLKPSLGDNGRSVHKTMDHVVREHVRMFTMRNNILLFRSSGRHRNEVSKQHKATVFVFVRAARTVRRRNIQSKIMITITIIINTLIRSKTR